MPISISSSSSLSLSLSKLRWRAQVSAKAAWMGAFQVESHRWLLLLLRKRSDEILLCTFACMALVRPLFATRSYLFTKYRSYLYDRCNMFMKVCASAFGTERPTIYERRCDDQGRKNPFPDPRQGEAESELHSQKVVESFWPDRYFAAIVTLGRLFWRPRPDAIIYYVQ
jgi:hypothetical protein